MDQRRMRHHKSFNDTQPAIIRLCWILAGASLLALVLCGSVLATSWLQPTNVVQMLRPLRQTGERQPVPLMSATAFSPASLSTATILPPQLTTLVTPAPYPNQAGSIKPNLVVTTVTVHSGVPIIRATPIPVSPVLTLTMYFPSGYAIPAGESLTFNDIISNAPGAGKTIGPITLSQTIPDGLNAIKAFGNGWRITSQPTHGPGNLKAIYTNTVIPGNSIPPLTIYGVITRNASPVLHMSATVSTQRNNDTKSEERDADVTVMPPLTVTSP